MGGGSGSTSYASPGERIFLSGVGSDGRALPRTVSRVAQGSLMMGGGGCASCHGADGRGGTLSTMSGAAIEAPDVDETGKPLDAAMPPWRMTPVDLGATIA